MQQFLDFKKISQKRLQYLIKKFSPLTQAFLEKEWQEH